jgi:hypothetical protein
MDHIARLFLRFPAIPDKIGRHLRLVPIAGCGAAPVD